MIQAGLWPITPGTQQSDRHKAPLQAGYFDVDELSFETLLSMATQMAGQLNYYDHNNQKQGNWQGLFSSCEVVIMAIIFTLNREKHEEKARHLLTLSGDLIEPIKYLFDHFVDIDFWYRQLQNHESASAQQLDLKLSAVIKNSLVAELAKLTPLINRYDKLSANEQMVSMKQQRASFDPIWQNQPEGLVLPEVNNRAQLQEVLYGIFAVVMSAIGYLQADVKLYLAQASANPIHDPACGLFMAFIKLFAKAQGKINTFTLRHRDFYYRDMLYFSPLPATPDSAYLLLSGQKSQKAPVKIKSGAAILCGKDNQLNDIVYSTDSDLTVTDAKVKQLYCMNLQRDNLVSPENALNFVTGITSEQKSFEADAELTQKRSLSMFGAKPPGREDNAEQVYLGLAIAAPILRLKQGKRHIEVIVNFEEPYKIHSQQSGPINSEQKIQAIFEQMLKNNGRLFEPSIDIGVGVNSSVAVVKRQRQAAYLANILSPQDFECIYNAEPKLQLSEIYKVFLLLLLQLAQTPTLVKTIFGRLFSRQTLSLHDWLTDEDIVAIRERFSQIVYAEQSEAEKAAKMEDDFRYLDQDKPRMFNALYSNTFNIRVSTAVGWKNVIDCAVKPVDVTDTTNHLHYGFRFELTLAPDCESLVPCSPDVHGADWLTDDPVIEFSIKPQATFFPYSIFRGLAINSINLNVNVKGVSDLVAYNQQGRLDPSKPFNPLGSQPNTHSYLIFGNQEIANKSVTELTLNLDWAQLPDGDSGFEEYYLGYEQAYANDSFRADISLLNSGQWLPILPSDGQPDYPLFRSASNSNRLLSTQILTANFGDLVNSQSNDQNSAEQTTFDYSLQSRNGWFKLALKAPQSGFGFGSYSGLLSNTLIHNVKNKKQLALPNLPYTPLLNSLTLNYRATSTIDLTIERLQQQDVRQQVIHIHPFGLEQVFPVAEKNVISTNTFLFPRYREDGYMFIGFSASAPGGELRLFFHLDQRANLVRNGPDDILWSCLVNNKWVALSSLDVIEDTTYGLLTSGYVTLNLPATMTDNNSVLSSGLYWLKVSANDDLLSYGDVYSVDSHAIKVTRQPPKAAANHSSTLALAPEDAVGISRTSEQWKSQITIPGLASISQKTPSFGGRTAECADQLTARASERLRHKGRAVTPWDYEHLILQAFEDIDKVKCFQHLMYGKTGHYPGHVLIVVRRKVERCTHDVCGHFKVPSEQLVRIRDFISALCSPFITIDVRNPDYETVQMRCSVRLKSNEQTGLTLSRLNQAFSDHICPWQAQTSNQGFGWSLQMKALKAFISQLDYVDFVTNFSLLHLTEEHNTEQEYYTLADSVDSKLDARMFKPLRPWSILMPAHHHVIEVINDKTVIEAEITGINEMQVGFNFIVQPPEPQSNHDTEESNHDTEESNQDTEVQVLNRVDIDGEA